MCRLTAYRSFLAVSALGFLSMDLPLLFFTLLLCLASLGHGDTDPGDVAVLMEFRRGLDNPELLDWPAAASGADPCGPPKWNHVYCSGSRVTQIQVQKLGLSGTLPASFGTLSMLSNLGFQGNKFRGALPSFKNLANLQYAFLNDNEFDAIPADFFAGLTSLLCLSLDNNPLNKSSGGWTLPDDLESSAQLTNLTVWNCSLVGSLPEFLGRMSSLTMLQMSYNNLTGAIPASFYGSQLQTLWLNNQAVGLSGSIDIIASMTSLTDVWLHGNQFSGTIPDAIGACSSLWRLWLNGNQLVGRIPVNLTSLPNLKSLQLDNNFFVGPVPVVKYNFSYSGNQFCALAGLPCSPAVTSLLDFLSSVDYPVKLAASWGGNDPCSANWLGVSCSDGKVTVINLPDLGMNGSIGPSLGDLDSLVDIRLDGNNLTGKIPANLTHLKSLKLLNVSSNNLMPPIPPFSSSVDVLAKGNPLLDGSPMPSPPRDSSLSPSNDNPSPSSPSTPPRPPNGGRETKRSKKLKVWIVAIPTAVGVSVILLAILFYFGRKGKRRASTAPGSFVIHPRDPSDPDNTVKIVVANNTNNSIPNGDLHSGSSSQASNVHVIDAGNFVISVQVLRKATKDFTQENVLGRGGFGVVYKGELHDGTMIAVKRMEAVALSNKALDEFQAEIAVLTKVRHRNLVSILGYSVEGNEKLLVYEYMPEGALSKHLFQWKELNLEPLSWKKRLNIALDVARGMEYLHNLAHHCFIHRDLKSANILLGDSYRAKVSDFGLAKLAPDGKYSVATRLAGTFGYLAPEYAVTGKITTKADVFSYGVVLMELVTGLQALDEDRPEETRYLASWFCHIRNDKEKLKEAIDPSLDVSDETIESISIIAELAGHCAAREAHQRPDMGHAVSVLVPLVGKWKPVHDEHEEYMGIDLHQPLLQMVKGWQAADSSTGSSSTSLSDSKGSIPARPAGFAESFTSADGR